jgi:hypothetical protein
VRSAHLHRLPALVRALVLAAALTACAPQSPDHSSWTDQAHLALQDTSGQLATATLLLRLARDDKTLGKYEQVVAQDSEKAAGATMSRFGGEQPEPEDDAEYTRVTGLLSAASDLLSQVRIAVVRRDTVTYPQLLERLDRLRDRLDEAAADLRKAPR